MSEPRLYRVVYEMRDGSTQTHEHLSDVDLVKIGLVQNWKEIMRAEIAVESPGGES